MTVSSLMPRGRMSQMILQMRYAGCWDPAWTTWFATGGPRLAEKMNKIVRAEVETSGAGNDRRALIGMRISGMVAHRIVWTH